jgi:subtilisin family serine protease
MMFYSFIEAGKKMKNTLLFLLSFFFFTALNQAQILQPLSTGTEIKAEVSYTPQNKLSARLHSLLNDEASIAQANAKMLSGKPVLQNNIPTRVVNNKLLIGMLIKTNDPGTLQQQIEAVGGLVETIAGDIMVVEVPVNDAQNIALSDAAIYSDVSISRKPLLNNSRVAIKADIVQAGTGLPQGYNGKNVVVGVVDSGIDWSYADFSNGSGTRIKYLWDMSGFSGAPTGYSYGTESTKSQIDSKMCTEADLNDGEGHGTHVSCIAAGNGATNSLYTGIATGADIIFVKGFRSGPGFSDNDVLNGCSYIFSKAQAMNEPAVINLSLGGQYGPHDGTSNYEQALSNLTGPGKIICASAGNDGNDRVHLSYAVSGSSTASASIAPLALSSGSGPVLIDMWYPQSGNITVGLALYSTSGSLLGYTTAVSPGSIMNNKAVTISGTTYGMLTIDATATNNTNNNCREVYIYLTNNNGASDLSNVTWCLYTYGSGTFDAWIAEGGKFGSVTSGSIKGGDNISSVAVPATAKKIICVGSYVTTPCWTSINKYSYCYNPAVTKDSLSSFSSMGPTRDGRLKPDLVAPGQAIVSALSSSLVIGTDVDSSWIVKDGKHQIMQGTSMAAPHVSGVVAMLLEKNRSLSYDQVYSILTSSTAKDSYTGQSATQLFGYGKLNALTAIQSTTTDVALPPNGTRQYRLYHNYPNPFNPSTRIAYDLPASGNVSLKVYDILGNEIRTLVNGIKPAGHYEVEFNAGNIPTGIYIYQLKAGGNIISNKMLLVK